MLRLIVFVYIPSHINLNIQERAGGDKFVRSDSDFGMKGYVASADIKP